MVKILCLYLYFSCTRLKHYIKHVDLYVLSHFDIIKHMLSKPILHSQIGKWPLVLTQYSLTYMPLKAMKGKVVADFIVDHALVEIPQNFIEPEPRKLYFDGSSHREGTGVGVLIISHNKIQPKFKYMI